MDDAGRALDRLAQVPALLVRGKADRLVTPIHLARWRQQFPRAQVLELEDVLATEVSTPWLALINLRHSAVTDGAINQQDGVTQSADSTITNVGTIAAISDLGNRTMLTRVQLSGHVSLSGGSNAQFLGVMQGFAGSGNSVDNSSFLRIGDAAPANPGGPAVPSSVLGITLRNFSIRPALPRLERVLSSCALARIGGHHVSPPS